MSDLESANEKLELSSNTFNPISLDRFECEALIQEYNEMDDELCELQAKELRMEWPILLLVVIFYAAVAFAVGHYSEQYLLNYMKKMQQEIQVFIDEEQ